MVNGRVVGPNARPLLERDIIVAQQNTKGAMAAARYLNVGYETYKKYAKLYGIFDQHVIRNGRGIPRKRLKGAFGLDAILANKHPGYSKWKLKERLVAAGYLPDECALCGFDEKRVGDGRTPLSLYFEDGNQNNVGLDNISLRCANCVYLTTGTIRDKRAMDPGTHDTDLIDAHNLSPEDIEKLQDDLWAENHTVEDL